MSWIAFAYVLLVLFTGVPAIFRGDVASGIAGLIAPLLAIGAGGGIVNTLRDPRYPIHIGAGVAIVLLGLAFWWMSKVGWWVNVGPIGFGGGVEVAIGFLVGILFEVFNRDRP